MEGNIVSRVRETVLILAAKYKYKLNNLFSRELYQASAHVTYRFFARNVARFRI